MDFFLIPLSIHFIFCFLHPFATAQNITLGSSLTANGSNSSWVSPSGDFAFGFRNVKTNGYLLAIWFDKIPEKTIVWWARVDALAEEGSKVQLTTDGKFVLLDPNGKQIWPRNLSDGGAAYAAMLDSGNFVVAKNNAAILWQSFDEPTDTILPTQILDLGSRLVARHSDGNYSSGRFELRLQSNGDLGFFTRNVPLDAINSAYWEIESGGSGHQVNFNQSGLISFDAINGSVLGFLSNKTSTGQFYQRAILEYDGVFRHYVYPKSANSTGWRQKNWTTISFVPPNICTSVVQQTGSGACGFNSYCKIESDGRRQCLCPLGYNFFDPDDETSGCKPNFLPQSCDIESQEADHFHFSEVVNLDWPLSDYEHYQLVTEEWCKDVCLNDCFCAVAIFGSNNCWKKKNPLSNGMLDPSVDRYAFVKVRKGNSTFFLGN